MSFGEALREAREELGKSAKEVAGKLQIPGRVIEALEREEIATLPPRVYARGFLKKYAEYLGFSPKEILNEFDLISGANTVNEAPRAYARGIFGGIRRSIRKVYIELCRRVYAPHSTTGLHPRFSAKADKRGAEYAKYERRTVSTFLDHRKIMLSAFLAVWLAIAVYFSYVFRYVWDEPKLIINTPAEDLVTDADEIRASGFIEEEASIALNGKELAIISDDGAFDEVVFLRKGLNALEFETKNRLGKIKKVVRYVFVK